VDRLRLLVMLDAIDIGRDLALSDAFDPVWRYFRRD
jgi:hypothetical protein